MDNFRDLANSLGAWIGEQLHAGRIYSHTVVAGPGRFDHPVGYGQADSGLTLECLVFFEYWRLNLIAGT